MAQLILTILVVLGFPRRNTDLIAFVKVVLAKMTGNAYFTTPTPTLASVSTVLATFESSETSMGLSKGVKGDRAAKRAALVTLLNHLRDYVQSICEQSVDNAGAIAESAGMRLKNHGARVKALISVVQGLLSGSVICDAKAVAPTATYYWFYSLDQRTWTAVPEQMKAKLTLSGLTPGQTYAFRFRALTRKGMGDFSQIVLFMVK